MVTPHPSLGPGSSVPSTHDEVEALLRRVPEVAFDPELQACVPADVAPQELTPDTVDAQADESYLTSLREHLARLEDRAQAEQNGGLSFLAVTLRHFLAGQVRPSEHPLVVALFLRAQARAAGRPDTPATIVPAMDVWDNRDPSR